MTLSTLLAVGEKAPIATVLEDGNVAQYPQAVIYNPSGTVLATLDLSHVADGLYTNTYTMPNLELIEIVYIVYSDAAHTIENTKYGRDLDIFVLNNFSMDTIVEGGLTFKDTLRLVSAVLLGKSGGGGTATVHFRDLGDTKNRVEATVTTAGNRMSVTLDASD